MSDNKNDIDLHDQRGGFRRLTIMSSPRSSDCTGERAAGPFRAPKQFGGEMNIPSTAASIVPVSLSPTSCLSKVYATLLILDLLLLVRPLGETVN